MLTCCSIYPQWHNRQCLPVAQSVDSHAHVPRLFRAGVKVAIIFWQQVDIVENVALEGVQLRTLQSTHIHQLRPVEFTLT